MGLCDSYVASIFQLDDMSYFFIALKTKKGATFVTPFSSIVECG